MLRFIWLVSLLVLWVGPVHAHPEPQEPMRLVVSQSGLELRVQSSLRAVFASIAPRPAEGPYYSTAELARAAREHADYLLAHLRVRGDTRLLTGRVIQARMLEPLTRPIHRSVDLDTFHVESTFDFPFLQRPQSISVEQSVLAGLEVKPGVPGRQEYLVSVKYAGESRVVAAGLLTHELGFDFIPRWDAASTARPVAPVEVRASHYLQSGLFHILSGWDHLLFVGALAIAARRLLDLVKVVAAFTLAHSLTLTLAALGWLSLPAALVEPLIAISIVVVSVDNLRRRERVGTRLRLAAAFGFGLVHGLGFAGPLVEALSGVSGFPLAKAILAFSAGVEIGHQLVVLPLFGLVAWLGRHRPERGPLLALRYGSIVTAGGGTFFLIRAIGTFVVG